MENGEHKFKTQKTFIAFQFCLRIFAIAATLATAWLTLTNKESTQLGIFVIDARYSYSSAFRFFALANVVVCAFSVLSLMFLFVVARYGSNSSHFFFMFLHDLFMMCLVLAGCAAATAIGFVGKYGNSHSGWMPICDHFARFCHRVTITLILSYLSLVFLLILTITSASNSRQIQR
ncbi:hypothetical protein P3X46_023562 [Hevea brasiliensis]|uniref:CASP-like protein n=1 Tax=Hevea brasiliensis TaxID=3981 RepID=A0ABQ9LBC5_HEVBR|nr:CASP-like protein 1F1 [Hevea brasiliensis]KAJ9163941.1 hypothetical protein P3X46_023562 [Hevea brasiliensis]